MNAIQLDLRVNELIDRTRTARHSIPARMNAINGAIMMLLKDRIEAIRVPRRYSVQSSERLRSELYPLVIMEDENGTPIVGADLIPYPTADNYLYYLLLFVTINGVEDYSKPTSFDTVGPLLDNPFTKPTTVKSYFNEQSNGLKLYFGSTGTFSAYKLWYLKNPNIVSIGNEVNQVAQGDPIVNGDTYYVYEEAVYDSITYYEGATFVGNITAPTLTSGLVIPASVVVNTELPINLHEEICVKAAAILSGTVEDYNKKISLKQDIEEN